MKFLGNVLATVVGLFIFFMFLFFGVVLIAALAGSGDRTESVKNNSVIELDLSKVGADYAGKFRYEDIDYFEDNHDGLIDVLRAIEYAKTDSKIKGISILNDRAQLGIAQLKAVRDALEDFKRSGKFVYAYANSYTQREYYLNSVADEICLNPEGDMEFKGLSTELMFLKDLQDKSGVQFDVIRHGKYKSAVEPFLENKMSDANREQVTALLQSVWGNLVADIAKSRHLSTEKLNAIADGLLARTPQLAKKENLVDHVVYEDVYHDQIRKKLDVDKDEEYNTIDMLDYANEVANTSSNFSSDAVAVIYAQGEIMGGEGDINTIGEGAIREALREARLDDDVKAIVLRIDSPGGDALTSDLIWREIELTKKAKPVVVSMGNIAASGGYYIACNSDRIFAEANTITGSIGVFGLLPNFTPLATKVGIHTERVSTHSNAGGYSPFVPLDDPTRLQMQESIERVYQTFVTRVATGRKMPFEAVDAIAQGRVWSGTDAKRIGLVDEIGGLDDAIAYAAKQSKMKKFRVEDYPEYKRDFRDLLGNLGLPFLQSQTQVLRETIGESNYAVWEQVKKAQARTGIQTLLPVKIDIK